MRRWKMVLFILFSICELLFAVHRYPQLLTLRRDLQNYRKAKRGSMSNLEVQVPAEPKSFQEESDGVWVSNKDSSLGFFHMSGGHWRSTAARTVNEAADDFISRHLPEVLGITGDSLKPVGPLFVSGSNGLEYRQLVDGMIVLNSFLRLLFDDKLNLVAIDARLYFGSRHSISPRLSLDKAARLALTAIREHVDHAGADSSLYRLPLVTSSSEYDAVLEGGELVNMYHFVIAVQSPLSGTLDLLINADSGEIASIKNVSSVAVASP